MTATIAPEARIEKLNRASARRVINPDTEVPGEVGPGQIVADELLSVAGLDLDLTPEQRSTLSREEIASITDAGIRFEAVLTAGFALQIATTPMSVTDPRIAYLLHEIGEESRHSRLFARVNAQLDPQAKSPFGGRLVQFAMNRGVRRIISLPSLLYTLVLAGEEIPDLIQKRTAEHPDTDPFIREVNKYHRLEEARHLSFARAVLPEIWAEASVVEKIAVRRVAPFVIRGMFETLVHPGVYAAVGLPAWETWKAVNKTPQRIALRKDAIRPVLQALLDAGVFRGGQVTKPWQHLCGVDAAGRPVAC
ncbi:MAG TPA: diiron oxygenase [Acidimicrobiales bacterium]|nr:diiron oxygenase [Acidimicrobiales bacterium]